MRQTSTSIALLQEIENFLEETGMKPYRFGIDAASNGRLVERLRSGGRVWPETEVTVRAFMQAHKMTRPASTHRGAA